MGNDAFLDVKDFFQLLPGIVVQTENGLVFLNAPPLSFAGRVWHRGNYRVVSIPPARNGHFREICMGMTYEVLGAHESPQTGQRCHLEPGN